MNEKNYSIPWEQYAGEAEHYSYVRCLDLGQIYEVVRVTHEKHGLRNLSIRLSSWMSMMNRP